MINHIIDGVEDALRWARWHVRSARPQSDKAKKALVAQLDRADEKVRDIRLWVAGHEAARKGVRR